MNKVDETLSGYDQYTYAIIDAIQHCLQRNPILIRTLTGHGHRINTLALSSDYVLRTGPYCTLFNLDDGKPKENMIQKIKRYQQYPNQAKEDAIAIYNNYKKKKH